MLAILSDLIEGLVNFQCLRNGADFQEAVEQYDPDLILLDVHMPGIDGLTLCRSLKESDSTKDIPVIFITGLNSIEQENECWRVGASDFIRKPFNQLTALHRIKNHLVIKQQYDQLAQLSLYDPLTELFNRRHFDQQLEKEIASATRNNRELALMMIDIDYFKNFNDHYGHLEGDACLQFVSLELLKHLHRASDWAARFGGEEFVIVLPETDSNGARCIAEKIVEAFNRIQRPHEASPLGYISISIGLSQWEKGLQAAELIDQADKKLYIAKHNGRNRAE